MIDRGSHPGFFARVTKPGTLNVALVAARLARLELDAYLEAMRHGSVLKYTCYGVSGEMVRPRHAG